MDINFYSFSDPLNSGVDFYTADEFKLASSSLTIESNVIVDFEKFSYSQISIDVNSNTQTNATKIAFAQSNVTDILSATVTVGTRVKNAEIVINSSCLVETSAIKIAYSQCSISIDSNAVSNSTKIAKAALNISGSGDLVASMKKEAYGAVVIAATSSATTAVTKISFIASALSASVNLMTAGRIALATIRMALGQIADISATAIKFTSAGIVDSSLIRTLLLIDEKPITSHNRKFDSGLEPIFTQNVNWNNRKTRYYKSTSRSGRRVFNLSWSWLPNSNEKTVDGKRGRDFIKEIASDPSYHTFRIINLDESGLTPPTEVSYNVLVKDYNESLIRRDLSGDVFFWDCSLTLEEV